MPKWKWLGKVARYWNDTVGKVVPRLQVRRWADQSIVEAPVTELAADLASRKLTVGEWEARFRKEIKDEAIRQYIAGRGGLDKMTKADWGSIGGTVADQFRYLNRFAREVAAGNLTEAQIARRMEMYINSTREAYERAYARATKEAGLNTVRWTLGIAEHCEDCVAFAAMGNQLREPWPFKNGRRNALPGSGDTVCLTNCRCSLIYGK